MATRYYSHHLLRRCVGGWLVEVGREKRRREREEEERRHRERMEAFLAVAETTSLTVSLREEGEGGGGRVNKLADPEALVGNGREAGKEKGSSSEKRGKPQPTMWQSARKHVVS